MFKGQVTGDEGAAPKPGDRQLQGKRQKYRYSGPAVSHRARRTYMLGTVGEHDRE